MNFKVKSISHDNALKFMRAGKAIMTIESKKTQKHFTFKFRTPKDVDENTPVDKIPVWVYVLTGSDNNYSYSFVGTIFGTIYHHSKKSRINEDATSVVAFKYWLKGLATNNTTRLNQIELYHSGKCMRCGRKLTTPDSINTGVGPVCGNIIERLEVARQKKMKQTLEISGIDASKVNDETVNTLINFM
jgi:predicted RNA-binding Zn-ribbon protein involved in translation (DUF1610 family)